MLERFGDLVAQPEPDWLTGALLLALDVYPRLNVEATRSAVRSMARDRPLGRRLELTGLTPQRQAEGMADLLYHHHGFEGCDDGLSDPRNSYLNEVLERKRGLPITLALIYVEVAKNLNVDARGVGFPGHFLVKIVDREPIAGVDRSVWIDPAHGGAVLSETDMSTLAERATGNAELEPSWLQPVSSRDALKRMLANLRRCYQQSGQRARLLVILHRLLELAPEAASVLRDRGVLQASMGAPHAAIDDLEAYLDQLPRAADAQEIQELLDELREKVHGAGPTFLN